MASFDHTAATFWIDGEGFYDPSVAIAELSCSGAVCTLDHARVICPFKASSDLLGWRSTVEHFVRILGEDGVG